MKIYGYGYGNAFAKRPSSGGASLPVNTVAPVVSGTAVVGQSLTTTDGTWTGTPSPTFSYQWYRGATPISGATNSTYTLVQADAGQNIKCTVTATNGAGSASADSNTVAVIRPQAGGGTSLVQLGSGNNLYLSGFQA